MGFVEDILSANSMLYENSGARASDVVAILEWEDSGILEFSLLPKWALILSPLDA